MPINAAIDAQTNCGYPGYTINADTHPNADAHAKYGKLPTRT